MKSVGIDIGSSSIKVVELSIHSKGFHLSNAFEHAIGKNPGFDPQIEIVDYLKNLALSYEPGTKFVFGMRQDRVSTRHKYFPFSDRIKILKSLPFELEEDLPFNSDSAVFDAKVIQYEGAQTELLTAAVPKHRLQELLDLLKDTGIEPSIISAEGFALANCFERWQEAPPTLPATAISPEAPQLPQRDIHCVVYIGHQRTQVLAFEHQKLVGVRTILWGSKNVIDGIVKKYELPFIEAQKEFTTKAFILPTKEGASYDQVVFSDTISAQYKELARDIKISLLEFKSEFNGEVKQIQLSGGGAQVLNLNAALTQYLEVPCNKIESIRPALISGVELHPKTSSVFAVALGLAIEGIKRPRNPALNFLKGEFAQQNQMFQKLWQNWGTTIQVGIAAFFVFVIYSIVRESTTLSIADRANEVMKTQARSVAKLPVRSANESGVRRFIRDQKRKIDSSEKLSGIIGMNSAMDILKRVSDASPSKSAIKMDVTVFRLIEDTVSVEGTVDSQPQLKLLQTALMNVAQDGKVLTTRPTRSSLQPNKVPFSFQFKVQRGL